MAVACAPTSAKPADACLTPGAWHTLKGDKPQTAKAADVLADAARRDVVLLGEHHDDADHHRWQLQTLAALHLLRPRMVIGFEAFPRRMQPVLDEWVAGRLSARQFLERVEWEKIWNFAPELYMPLFEFARLNRVPMAALNVERSLTSSIREKGWDAVPNALKEGISRPAPASSDYETYLFEIFGTHASSGKQKPAPKASDPAFRYFVESQTTWDRAMAEALASRVTTRGEAPLVVGIVGAGHVRNGYGVAHQLRYLGVTRTAALLPSDAKSDCGVLSAGLADALFAITPAVQAAPPPPRLGVQLELADGAVRIVAVEPGSLAERSGVKAGDRIVALAGAPAAATSGVVAAVRGALPGTWLPIQVRRGSETIDLLVKFPPKS